MTSVARWVEVHRLAVAGGEAGIARDVGGRVGGVWLARSRFADAARLAGLTLTLGEDARALYQLGWAKNATGNPAAARECFGHALRLYRAAGDRGNEAGTLSNIGAVYRGLGERQRALEYYGLALPLAREVGDRTGEAVTRYNVAMIHRAEGELGRAVAELEQVVELDRQLSHPDLQSDTDMLHRVRQEQASSDPGRGSR
jgi:tetratricopeptide (TPR) repeat protein